MAKKPMRGTRISPLKHGTSRSEERFAPFLPVLVAVFAFMLLPSRRAEAVVGSGSR
jgi:hypothetical protein